MKVKAVFFDRDNTLTKKNPETQEKLKAKIEKITKNLMLWIMNKMFAIFDLIKQKSFNCKTY